MLSLLSNEKLSNYVLYIQKHIKYSILPKTEIDYRGNIFNSDAENFYKNCNCNVTGLARETKNKI